jgi:magnesium-transporting ATPase (P-type)
MTKRNILKWLLFKIVLSLIFILWGIVGWNSYSIDITNSNNSLSIFIDTLAIVTGVVSVIFLIANLIVDISLYKEIENE